MIRKFMFKPLFGIGQNLPPVLTWSIWLTGPVAMVVFVFLVGLTFGDSASPRAQHHLPLAVELAVPLLIVSLSSPLLWRAIWTPFRLARAAGAKASWVSAQVRWYIDWAMLMVGSIARRIAFYLAIGWCALAIGAVLILVVGPRLHWLKPIGGSLHHGLTESLGLGVPVIVMLFLFGALLHRMASYPMGARAPRSGLVQCMRSSTDLVMVNGRFVDTVVPKTSIQIKSGERFGPCLEAKHHPIFTKWSGQGEKPISTNYTQKCAWRYIREREPAR
jgi:hypothetical protein